MGKMIATCRLNCNDCIAFIATQENDDKMREKVVEAWSTEKGRLKLEDVDCDGCTVGKRLHSFYSVCNVRKCGLKKSVENSVLWRFSMRKTQKTVDQFSNRF